MTVATLTEIKKELNSMEKGLLVDICLKLAKLKKDNKEFLSYLLFESANPDLYVENLQFFLQESFELLSKNPYLKLKELRKILRILSKHLKFIRSPVAEIELLSWYCNNLINKGNVRISQKSLYSLLVRQLKKIHKDILSLHPDLQFDYGVEFNKLLDSASDKIPGFDRKPFTL